MRHWLNGLTREEIVKKEEIGAGTVTGIIQEARKEEEYSDIDLLREVSKKLKEEGLALPSLGFAIRLRRIREENDIKEDQIEAMIQNFAVYRLRHNIPYDTIIKIGREALDLEQKFDVPIEKIPEYIVQGKETIDRLEDQRQDILRQKQQAREDHDAIRQKRDALVAEIEKYVKEIPSIQLVKELKNELAEAKEMIKRYEIIERVLTKERDDARHETMRLNTDVIELETGKENLARQLSSCMNELDKLSKKSTNTSNSNG
jgi:chromosome segregation ATPase